MKTRPQLLLAMVLALLASIGVSAGAQETRPRPAGNIPRIGLLGYGTNAKLVESFRQSLLEFGRVEGRDFVFESLASAGSVDELAGRAEKLVGLNVDVILANGPPSVRAAMKATSAIPIVMVGIGHDPVQLGLVPSLGRPGGNVTGVAQLGAQLWEKRVQLLREIFPQLSRVAFLSNPSNPGNVASAKEFGELANAVGMKVRFFTARDPEELERAFAEIGRDAPEALACSRDILLLTHAKELGDFALRNRLPTLTPIKEFVAAGAMISYGAQESDQWKRAARYVDKILKGAKPADLPVELPMRFELVINLKTANALGVTIPPELLLLADKVIE